MDVEGVVVMENMKCRTMLIPENEMSCIEWGVEDIIGIQISIGTFSENPSPSNHFLIQFRHSRNHNKVIVNKNLFHLRIWNQIILLYKNRRSRDIPLVLIDCISISSNHLQIIIETNSVYSETIDVQLNVEFGSNLKCLIWSESDFINCFVIGKNIN